MDSGLKIGYDQCLAAASKAEVPSFWFLETGMQTKGVHEAVMPSLGGKNHTQSQYYMLCIFTY